MLADLLCGTSAILLRLNYLLFLFSNVAILKTLIQQMVAWQILISVSCVLKC